jgi:hypothetical protein
MGVEQVIHGLEAQVAHGHGVELGIDQGDGKPGAPLPHHGALFLGQDLLQVSFELGGHGGKRLISFTVYPIVKTKCGSTWANLKVLKRCYY